eukprot:CAMPEP_0204140326 /NCGR_PEP_ID=MMETSP0361-20130328/18922_1 /ASSEMBLY_ACC=CAM_ASM_000343 /TAXON_ID=268821 /ORGANISM="Scrippsiella Hangoei, Strain SHTV-5" /LENGTH=231 /DNA_ID=CAMNT_0051094135 /DNA_START=29 /DNA_END=725 /DNA_ORIENTATION=-
MLDAHACARSAGNRPGKRAWPFQGNRGAHAGIMSPRQTIPLPRRALDRRATRQSRQDRRLRGGLRQGGALEHLLGLQGGRLLRAPRVVGRARVACAPHGLLLIREVARRLRGPQRGQRGNLVLLLRHLHDPAAARQLVDGRLPRLQVRGLAALRGSDHEVRHAGAVVEHRVVHRDHAGAVVASMPPTAVVEDRHVSTGAIGGEQVANLVEARHSHSDDALSARNTKKYAGQ